MENFKLSIYQSGALTELTAPPESTFLDAMRDAGITGIHAPCGGNGTCKQCLIRVTGEVAVVSSGEVFYADDAELLSCCHSPRSNCTITIPESEKMEVLTVGAGDIAPCGDGLGVAVDIGTTTVAVYLYDLESGKKLEVESDRNAQRPFGADVISRIQFSAEPSGLAKLRDAVRKQISDAMDACCQRAGRERREISRVSIAANTVMEHIFMDLSPVSIGVAPFETLSLFGDTSRASAVFEGLSPDATVYLCPALAGYVGGDITAGIFSSDAWESEAPCFFLDIGTNGEMGIGDKDGYTCCATAAGPAFEGAEIECGMDGSAGAINEVWYENGKVNFTVIGGGKATGICGSGLVDALCAMLRCGAIQENGRMSNPEEAEDGVRDQLRPDAEGRMRFYLTDDVYISGDDVRQLQMAKSAIRAGIETLLETRKIKHSEVKQVIIAGGFGAYMSVKSACGIGLLPPDFLEISGHAGNTAGAGAAMTLSLSARETLAEISAKCDYLELSSSSIFMEKYIECMVFDEIEEVF